MGGSTELEASRFLLVHFRSDSIPSRLDTSPPSTHSKHDNEPTPILYPRQRADPSPNRRVNLRIESLPTLPPDGTFGKRGDLWPACFFRFPPPPSIHQWVSIINTTHHDGSRRDQGRICESSGRAVACHSYILFVSMAMDAEEQYDSGAETQSRDGG